MPWQRDSRGTICGLVSMAVPELEEVEMEMPSRPGGVVVMMRARSPEPRLVHSLVNVWVQGLAHFVNRC